MLAVLKGRDALVAMPTGFGKSLIYQVPAMILDRPTISPLIALMADQEQALKKRCVPVVAFHSRLRAAERRAALDRLQKGGRLVILTTPETLEAAATAPLFEQARPALLCIYEAHCISEWGHDFRPSYLRLGEARQRPGNLPTLALTATATPRVREDIAHPSQCIMLFDPADLEIQEHLQALSRPGVRHLERLEDALTAWTEEQRAPTPENLAYSAGVPARICEVLLSDLEEAGLVERDQAGGITIAVPPDTFAAGVRDLVAKLKTFRFEGERRLRLVADYAQSRECRSVFIRRYFGEDHPPRCGTCDRCRSGHAVVPPQDRPPRRRGARRGRRMASTPHA
jgi:ATP-dependent DNA helicase RecQ